MVGLGSPCGRRFVDERRGVLWTRKDHRVVEVRPMQDADVGPCEAVWQEAVTELRARLHLPPEGRTAERVSAMRDRIAYLLATDPGGCWVATDGTGVVGVAQALVRGDLWVLSLFGVLPRAQGRGIARRLLDRALAYGGRRRGIVLSSRDPKAIRLYALAGFDLHPAVTAWGYVQHERLPAANPDVRDGTADDLVLVQQIDVAVRGAPHGADLEHLRADARLLVLPGRGYAVVGGNRPLAVAALDQAAAADLLVAALWQVSREQVTEIGWLTAPQQWAVRVALAAGLELHPVGPMMVLGADGPPSPYVPTGAYA